jgi:hypothetical protein
MSRLCCGGMVAVATSREFSARPDVVRLPRALDFRIVQQVVASLVSPVHILAEEIRNESVLAQRALPKDVPKL